MGVAVAAPQAVGPAIAARATIGSAQAEMVRRLCADGALIAERAIPAIYGNYDYAIGPTAAAPTSGLHSPDAHRAQSQ